MPTEFNKSFRYVNRSKEWRRWYKKYVHKTNRQREREFLDCQDFDEEILEEKNLDAWDVS